MTLGARVYANRHSEPNTLIIRDEPYMYVRDSLDLSSLL